MKTGNDCPPKSVLKNMVLGKINTSEIELVEQHIGICDRCQSLLQKMNSKFLLSGCVQDLKKATKRPAALKQAISRAKAIGDTRKIFATQPIEFSNGESRARQILARDGYIVRSKLGQGGMGVVYKAYEQSLDRKVAIKVLAPHFAQNEEARIRFVREARAAAAIVHPNVITVHAVSEGPELPYLVMEYVKGHSLRDQLNAATKFSSKSIVRIGRQISSALEAAENKGILHRDVKPANIFINAESGLVLLGDFGLAQVMDNSRFTKTGVVLGTPDFIAPEVLKGNQGDNRSDLFSLGVLLYELCSGRSPFHAETALATLHRISSEQPESLETISPNTPPWLVDIIEKLLAKEPKDRFQSATDVKRALSSQAESQRLFFPKLTGAKRKKRLTRWRWALPIIFGGLLLVICIVLLGLSNGMFAGSNQTTRQSQSNSSNYLPPIPNETTVEDDNGFSREFEESDPEWEASDEPFVSVSSDGEILRSYDDIRDAIVETPDGGKLEIRSNDEIEILQVIVVESDITISAASGFEPTLTFSKEDRYRASESSPMFLIHGVLWLQDLAITASEEIEDDGFALFHVEPNGCLKVESCRISLDCEESGACISTEGELSIIGSEIHSPNTTAFYLCSDAGNDFRMSNCFVSGELGFDVSLEHTWRFEIEQSTVACHGVFRLSDYHDEESFTIYANRSIFFAGEAALWDNGDQIGDMIRWEGASNVFSGVLEPVDDEGQDEISYSDLFPVWRHWSKQQQSTYMESPFRVSARAVGDRICEPGFFLKNLDKNPDVEAGATR